MKLDRRDFMQAAAAMGASLAWARSAHASPARWRERRDRFPEGVASGDPDSHSVILWTRRPFEAGPARQMLTVQVAEDPDFRRIVVQSRTPVSAAADWTTRVLVAGLKPARVYWYRFSDLEGNGSRIGRTITAPSPDDARSVNFAFVSCQSINDGKLNGYRRMIFEDEQASRADQLSFVLHLGDFIYETLLYPDEVASRYDRQVFEVARLEEQDSTKVGSVHIPLTVEGYRAIYRAYLHDPDLQDARARWPFIAMWDNHEFSWQGWQSFLKAPPLERPAQTVKLAANQAWFEFQPARVSPPSGSLEEFGPPAVKDAPITAFDADGLGTEPNNIAALKSLTAYRALRYGRHLDLLITDQHSYRSKDPIDDPAVAEFGGPDFLNMFPEDVMKVLDGGRSFNGGHPPATISFGDLTIPNPQKDGPPQTVLGAEQKRWFMDRLRQSRATWKVWGNSLGCLDWRADPQNLPAGLGKPWPAGFANLGGGDHGNAYLERGEIYDLVRDEKITGFAIIAGDRHSFWAGYAAKGLPPETFEPVGVSFVGASLASPGLMEIFEHKLPKSHPLRPLFLVDRPGRPKPEWTYNMLLRHGVRSCLDYAKTFDRRRARKLSNAALSPHLEFVDIGAHGYAKVRLDETEMRTEFVCIPRPISSSRRADGGPLRYRVVHSARLWQAGERPRLRQEVLEGDAGLAV